MNLASPLSLAGLAVALALVSALASLFTRQSPALMRHLVMPALALSGVLALGGGLMALTGGQAQTLSLPMGLPWLHWELRLDVLSGFFMALIGAVVIGVAIYGPGYTREFEHGNDSLPALGGFTGVFVAGMMLVVLANDAFMFMVAWEVMSLSSYFLVAFQHEHASNRRAAFLYLLMAHVGGLCILLGYGVLASFGDGFAFDAMRAAQLSPGWASIAFLLAFVGFGMKAGLIPLHVWLPEAHPVAPSHISALMSGVMLKVAVYGFVRFTFDLLADFQWQWGVLVLIAGAVSALMGVLYALMQHDLKRLLAYHSVENIGIIYIGLGLSLIFLGTGHTVLGVLGLIAALYHTINHALFKGLLFLGAGAILHSAHERDMEQMGGLLRRMPWTGLFFLVGCISISALPPFNGFVSEWLTFQAALQAWALKSGVLRTLLPLAAAMLALTGALAAACFVKVYGVAFLGKARSRPVRHAREVSLGMRVGQGWLAALCLVLGVLPTFVVGALNNIPQQLLGQGLAQSTAHGWLWLTPVSANTASYSAPLVLVGLVLAWWLASRLLRRGAVRKVRRCDTWDCGFAPPSARMQYTATAFAQPIRKVFGGLFRIDESVNVSEDGRQRHSLHVSDRIWGWIYLPIVRATNAAAKRVTLIQSGNVRIYLGWSLGTLVVLLWLIS